MIAIIDLEVGNIGSVINAFRAIGCSYQVIKEPSSLSEFEKIVLPGVGSFGVASKQLFDTGFHSEIRSRVLSYNTPLLGICVGMQLLATSGDEGGPSAGLELINAQVTKLDDMEGNRSIPHMGWNDVRLNSQPIFDGLGESECFYFVHSYEMKVNDFNGVSVAYADYFGELVAYVRKGNVYGVQFHPEKSQSGGMKLLRNFVEKC